MMVSNRFVYLGAIAAVLLSVPKDRVLAQAAPAPKFTADPMPGMNMNPGQSMADKPMGSMDSMAGMGMSSSVDLNDPMSQEASGTAWLPASSPMFGKMFMQPNGAMLMIHGAAMPRYTNVGSKRGDRRIDAPNWFMGMYSHPLANSSQLGLRAMMSLDPIAEGGNGYPLLFQTGETWHGKPLHDRQHPHDLFDELSATLSHKISSANSAYLYLAYPGEPALGPPTYMHRLIAYDLADAPIGHHWQDATHITFGVATVGLNFGSKVKIEASSFTGREPNEDRYNFDQARFDSGSARLSYNPDLNNALQVSYGFVKNPEGDGANVHRTTASWIYNKPLGMDSNITTTLVWGQNDLSGEGKTNSYLGEIDYQASANTYFTRLENITKSGRELVLPAVADQKFNIGAYTLGMVHDLDHGRGIDTGIGATVTVDTKPSGLDPYYGTGTPMSFQVFVRFRPSRMKMGAMDKGTMSGMEMSNPAPAAQPPPVMTAPEPTPPANAAVPTAPVPLDNTASNANAAPKKVLSTTNVVANVSASVVPSAPHSRALTEVVIDVTDSDGHAIVGATVKATVSMTTMDMGTKHPPFADMGDGTYSSGLVFAMGGKWQMTVVVTPKDGKPFTKTIDFDVAR